MSMPRQLPLFSIATLGPALLIAIAAVWGGLWVVAALVVLTLLSSVLDEVVSFVTPPAPDMEFPAATGLSVALAIAHFGLMILIIGAIALGGRLGGWEKAGLFLAGGLYFGQVSNANAHELIHRSDRWLHRLGMWVYISLFFGHHTSAHPQVHHVRVATRDDPATAWAGESFYRYARRAWIGGFREGFRSEAARLSRRGKPSWRNPYVFYVLGAILLAGLSLTLAGPLGLIVHLGLAGYAQTQLLMSDYVQHYGLVRGQGTSGKPRPVGDAHSWNSPHPISSALMMNAPRHSDHHARPMREWPALTLPDGAPTLPHSLPVMACLALSPRRWRRVMDPRAAVWRQREEATGS